MKNKKIIKWMLFIVLAILLCFGIGKLYYFLTAGFSIRQITSDLSYNPEWETHPLSSSEKKEVNTALDQEYTYLGKGCQSYVFASEDGNYVIKFLKHQHFRPQRWINLFTFIPSINEYQQTSKDVKRQKLEKLFIGCKIAFEDLKSETGIIYVHLNKSNNWKKTLTIVDRLGFKHHLDVDRMEFILQHRAKMFADTIIDFMEQSSQKEAELLIDRLLVMLISEYQRGIADNDHALMQNTGVLNGRPIHIDIGQFIHNQTVQDPVIYKKEVFDKTFLFHQWLKTHYPTLSDHLKNRLLALIGPDYFFIVPYKHKGNVNKMPHQPQVSYLH